MWQEFRPLGVRAAMEVSTTWRTGVEEMRKTFIYGGEQRGKLWFPVGWIRKGKEHAWRPFCLSKGACLQA